MPNTLTKSKWVSGILTFYNAVVDYADGISIGGVTVGATAAELNEYSLTVYLDDAGTAGSVFVVAPHAGNIVGLQAVSSVQNATTKTVLLAKIATVTVTSPAWEFSTTLAAGTASNVVPTALNAIGAGAVIEIATDGGSSASMPTMITIVISR